MTNLTRDVLIKTIVAKEMQMCDSPDYTQKLKTTYHKWEHESSDSLCRKYNQIQNANISVEILDP